MSPETSESEAKPQKRKIASGSVQVDLPGFPGWVTNDRVLDLRITTLLRGAALKPLPLRLPAVQHVSLYLFSNSNPTFEFPGADQSPGTGVGEFFRPLCSERRRRELSEGARTFSSCLERKCSSFHNLPVI